MPLFVMPDYSGIHGRAKSSTHGRIRRWTPEQVRGDVRNQADASLTEGNDHA